MSEQPPTMTDAEKRKIEKIYLAKQICDAIELLRNHQVIQITQNSAAYTRDEEAYRHAMSNFDLPTRLYVSLGNQLGGHMHANGMLECTRVEENSVSTYRVRCCALNLTLASKFAKEAKE